jgi:TonB-linked SusC/RagA family outer membrane protein
MKFFVPAITLGNSMPAQLLLMEPGSSRRGLAIKKQIVMQIKLITAFLLVGVIHVSAKTFSQQVTLTVKDMPLKQVFKLITDQTGYSFMVQSYLLDNAAPVTISGKDLSLSTILKRITQERGLTYAVKYNTIVVSAAGKKNPVMEKGGDVPAMDFLSPPPVEIKGRVVDKDGKPIVNALVKATAPSNRNAAGTTVIYKGVLTDEQGNFTIPEADAYTILVVSAVNIETTEFPLNGNNSFVTIVAKMKVAELSNLSVVNTGYQTLNKERATGSFGKPDMDIVRSRTSTMDIISRLDGQIPGMSLSISAINPGNASGTGNGMSTRKSLIRGISSANSSMAGEPLYVLNGVLVADFNSINPDDVEDITVLKDAAAAAIWGARATMGVIVITTKSGSRNQKLTVNYNGFMNYQGKPDFDYMHMMNSQQYIQTAQELFDPVVYPWSTLYNAYMAPHESVMYNKYRGVISEAQAKKSLDSLSAINNHNQVADLWYRPAFTTNHTLSVAGGTNIYSFYGSLAYTKTQTNAPGDKNDAYKLNFTQSINAGKRVRISLNTALVNTISSRKNPVTIPNNSVLPYQLFKNADGNSVNMPYMLGISDSLRRNYQARSLINLDYYPVEEMNYGYTKTNTLSMNVTANISVNIWKGLSFAGTYGYVKSPVSNDIYADHQKLTERQQLLRLTVAPTIGSIPKYYLPATGGTLTTGNADQRNWTARNQLVYDAQPRNGRDHLTIQAGQEAQESYSTRSSTTILGYNEALGTYANLDYAMLSAGISGTVTGFGSYGGSSIPYQLRWSKTRFDSYFGLASYTYNGKYSLDASWRQDRSSLFGSDISFQNKPIWSVGGRWQLGKEGFMQPLTWINSLAIRTTYGITGNSPYTGAAATTDILFAINSTYPGNINGEAFTVNQFANNKLAWENTATVNIGIDYAILNKRISGSIDLYRKITTDMIGGIPVNPLSGTNTTTGNIGRLTNKGIEVSLHTINIQGKEFSWNSTLTMGYNTSKLNSYTAATNANRTVSGWLVGGPIVKDYSLQPVFAYRFAGLDNLGDPQVYLANNTITKLPGGRVVDDLKYMGTTQPVCTGGLSNTMRYKGFSLSLNMIYRLGGVMRRDWATLPFSNRQANAANFGGNLPDFYLGRWKKAGDEAVTNIPSYVASGTINATRRNINYFTYGDINIASAAYAKLRDVTLVYDLSPGVLKALKIQRLSIMVQATNFMVWKANSWDIDPEYQDAVQGFRSMPPSKHSYSLGLNLTF